MMHLKLLLPFLIFLNFGFGQTVVASTDDCVQDFTFTTGTANGAHPSVNDILITWDFTNVAAKQNLELIVDVQPLNACWKGLDGTERSALKTYKPVHFPEQNIGSQVLKYTELNCKCLKWKATIINRETSCKTVTKWYYTSFLKE